MVTLCDLAGLPESPRLHRPSSRTKLKKGKKRNVTIRIVHLVLRHLKMSQVKEKGYPQSQFLNSICVQVGGKYLRNVSARGSSNEHSIFDFYAGKISWILRVSA